MTAALSLDALWNSAPPADRAFQPDRLSALPEPARRYLEHAIARGTRLASAVRLRMHGEIKLGRWLPFAADQVICWTRGMIWRASTRLHGLPIRGSDRIVDGAGAMRWTLFGIFPVMIASGPDITRSAAGRLAAETVWLPSILCGPDVTWTAPDSSHARAGFTVQGHRAALDLTIDTRGRLEALRFQRWGNPDDTAFREIPFGGVVDAEGAFGSYTIPSRLRIGWHFGTARFESDGEFFRATIDEARYR